MPKLPRDHSLKRISSHRAEVHRIGMGYSMVWVEIRIDLRLYGERAVRVASMQELRNGIALG